MNILQIQTGNKLSLMGDFCVKRIKEVYPNCHYTLITDGAGEWPFVPNKIITKNKYDQELMNSCGVEISDPVIFSDYARFLYLSDHEDTLYIDCDVYCKHELKSMSNAGICYNDIFAIYSGESCGEIKEAFNFRTDKVHTLHRCGEALAKNAIWINSFFKHKPNNINN